MSSLCFDPHNTCLWLLSPFSPKKKRDTLRKDNDTSTSTKTRRREERAPEKPAGVEKGAPRWGTMEGGGEWKREGTAAALLGSPRDWGLQEVSGMQPGGRWAQPPPLAGPRRPRLPVPPGPARRPGHGRVAPWRGRGARGRTLPPPAAAQPSRNLAPTSDKTHTPRRPRDFWARPADPPRARPWPLARAPRAPHGLRL